MIFLVTETKPEESRSIAQAVLLDPIRSLDFSLSFPEDTHNLWILNPEKKQIICEQLTYDWIGSGVPTEGKHVTIFGRGDRETYIVRPHGAAEDEVLSVEDGTATPALKNKVLRSTENRITLIIHSEVSATATPFFLSSSSSLSPRRYEIFVQIYIRSLLDAPDLQGSTAWSKAYERSNLLHDPDLLHFPGKESIALMTEEYAGNMKVEEGLYLPISVHKEGVCVEGALLVGVCVKENTHQATLFMSDGNIPIVSGTELMRGITWEDDKGPESFNARIGTILHASDGIPM
jgi:hypothetical protein